MREPKWVVGDLIVVRDTKSIERQGLGLVVNVQEANVFSTLGRGTMYVYYVLDSSGKVTGPLFPGELLEPTWAHQ